MRIVVAVLVSIVVLMLVGCAGPSEPLGVYDVPGGKLTVQQDTTALYEPARPSETVTVELPESTGEVARDIMIDSYADQLRFAGFQSDTTDGCECLTGPRYAALLIAGDFNIDGSIPFEKY